MTPSHAMLVPCIIEPSPENLQAAVERWRTGDVIAFPTETVYGLGTDTFNAEAIARLYQLKGRPQNNPLIAHVHHVRAARGLAAHWPALADQLTSAFWPGPLTLVVQRADAVPDIAVAGLPTIAVRCPAHPVAQQLLAMFDSPISAPSANRSGHISPTTAQHVADDFAQPGMNALSDDLPPGARALLILDGGPCTMGIESTVIDLTCDPPCILRPGSVTVGMLEAVLGPGAVQAPQITQQAASPGTSTLHYAPMIPAHLVDTAELRHVLHQSVSEDRAGAAGPLQQIAVLSHSLPDQGWAELWIKLPPEPVAYAACLYRALRQAERAGVDAIVIERPPEHEPDWSAVHDRLRRATSRR